MKQNFYILWSSVGLYSREAATCFYSDKAAMCIYYYETVCVYILLEHRVFI